MMIEDVLWRLPGDPAQWWSVPAGGYVNELPEGAIEAPVESEAALRRMLISNALLAPGGPPPYVVSKQDLWLRASEAEVDAMDAEMASQPKRIQRVYDGASHISSDDAMFALLWYTLESLFGEEKTAVLLAPSQRT